jgi:hypothetical protein
MHRGSLFKLLRKGGDAPLDDRLVRSVAVSVARGMAHLHSRCPPLLHLVSNPAGAGRARTTRMANAARRHATLPVGACRPRTGHHDAGSP